MGWLAVQRGEAPLIVAFPHTGTDIPRDLEAAYASGWLARKDADWWIDRLYGFVARMGATTIRTAVSRSVIDVNRDPSGVSLYPGQATTELCPTTSFDGEPLYRGDTPDAGEIARRREAFFDPYHAALAGEVARLKAMHRRVVLYDAHSIRSHVPRLFDGELPQFNIGTDGTTTCAPELEATVADICAGHGSHVVNGRFRGGWTTRHYGRPESGVHAIQMELAMCGYMDEPAAPDPANWPPAFDPARAAPLADALRAVVAACLAFAREDA